MATFYDRHLVFSQLGFDSFTPIEYMVNYERNPTGWVKDEMLTNEILDTLRVTEGADFYLYDFGAGTRSLSYRRSDYRSGQDYRGGV